jgi:NitT/TauT family transport system permease protein
MRLYTWTTEGTALGPLWQQVLVTMQETVLGFLVGAVAGVVVGVLLGRSWLLSEVFSPYIKAANSIPRVVLGALFAISLGLDLKAKWPPPPSWSSSSCSSTRSRACARSTAT